MYEKLLVPLDGSQLAEAAIPHAEEMARKFGSEVVFIHVSPSVKGVLDAHEGPTDFRAPFPNYWARNWAPLPPTSGAPPASPQPPVQRDEEWKVYVDQQEDRIRAEARDYLLEAGRSLSQSGIKLTPVVVFGKDADEIIDYAKGQGVDLIVMSTHGRSGIGRWFAGSVAERVLRGASVPVLLVRCMECSDSPDQMRA